MGDFFHQLFASSLRTQPNVAFAMPKEALEYFSNLEQEQQWRQAEQEQQQWQQQQEH